MPARQGAFGSAATYRWPASACPPPAQVGSWAPQGGAPRAFEVAKRRMNPTASAPMRPPTSKPNTTSLRSGDQLRVHFPPLTSGGLLRGKTRGLRGPGSRRSIVRHRQTSVVSTATWAPCRRPLASTSTRPHSASVHVKQESIATESSPCLATDSRGLPFPAARREAPTLERSGMPSNGHPTRPACPHDGIGGVRGKGARRCRRSTMRMQSLGRRNSRAVGRAKQLAAQQRQPGTRGGRETRDRGHEKTLKRHLAQAGSSGPLPSPERAAKPSQEKCRSSKCCNAGGLHSNVVIPMANIRHSLGAAPAQRGRVSVRRRPPCGCRPETKPAQRQRQVRSSHRQRIELKRPVIGK